jgi:membrane-associated phospholipid phosphatase
MIEARRSGTLSCFAAVALLATGVQAGAQTESAPAPASNSAVPAVVSNVPSFSHLFKETITDLRRVPSADTFAWLGTGAVAALVAHTADQGVTRNFSKAQHLDEVFEPGGMIGGVPFQMGGAFATYTVGRLTKSPRVTIVGADLFRAQAVAQAMTFAVKLSVRRMRPDGTTLSFPSGHTATTFASATVLQRHFGWKFGVPAFGIATYVAASRVQAKRHFLSDVAFGAALGIVAGRTITVGRGPARFAVAPMAAPGGGGISFTWLQAR